MQQMERHLQHAKKKIASWKTEERDDAVPLGEQLRALDELVRAGKVRHVGVSNETPFGVCSFADDTLDRPVCLAQCKPAALKAVAEKLGEHYYGWLFVALSYRWLSADHPDPDDADAAKPALGQVEYHLPLGRVANHFTSAIVWLGRIW